MNWKSILCGLSHTDFNESGTILVVETRHSNVLQVVSTLIPKFKLLGSHSIYHPRSPVSYYEDQRQVYTDEQWQVQLIFEAWSDPDAE